MFILDSLDTIASKEEKIKIIVRLTTSCYHDHGGLTIKKHLRFLKRKCTGFNFIDEDCSMVSAGEVFDRITNLDECKDGIYQIKICNEKKDWETGYIDDYDYMLVEDKEKI